MHPSNTQNASSSSQVIIQVIVHNTRKRAFHPTFKNKSSPLLVGVNFGFHPGVAGSSFPPPSPSPLFHLSLPPLPPFSLNAKAAALSTPNLFVASQELFPEDVVVAEIGVASVTLRFGNCVWSECMGGGRR
jgi:hypothetical protein